MRKPTQLPIFTGLLQLEYVTAYLNKLFLSIFPKDIYNVYQ